MTLYPAITPSARTFTPGQYPHTVFQAMSGKQSRVRHSSVMIQSILQLRYSVLNEAEMIEILDHYNLVKGGFLSFELPAIVWSGNDNPNDFTLPGNAWRYSQPPEVEEVFTGPGTDLEGCSAYVVQVQLESVPGEGVGLLSPSFRARITFTPGQAANTSGPQFVVRTALTFGRATVPGFTQSIGTTFTPGTATGGSGVIVEGGFFGAGVRFRPGRSVAGLGRLFTIKTNLKPSMAIGGDGPNFNDVKILIHGWNGIKDDSFSNTQLTVNQDVVTTSTNPRFGSQSISVPSGDSNRHIRWTNITLTRPWTIEMWVWMNNFESNNFLFTQNPLSSSNVDSNLRVSTDRRLIIQIANADGDFLQTNAEVIQSSTWHHVAATVDETTLRLFVDGDLKASRSRPANLAYTFTLGQIGPQTIRFQEFRATNQCLYTQSFSRPVQTFPSLAGITHATVDGAAESVNVALTPGTATGV
jgi:hypothetical protein